MRTSRVLTATVAVAATGLLLTACSSDSSTDASPSASATAAAELNVGEVLASVKDSLDCAAWAGGKVAGKGVVAGWEYICDADEDGLADATLTIYGTAEAQDGDLSTLEGADSTTGIVRGEHFILVTTDPAYVAALADLGEVVRDAS